MHAINTTYSREEELSQINAARLDPSRFAPLYDRHYKLIFLFIHHRVRDKELTADLTAQVFLKAMLNLSKYVDRGHPFSSWLYRIALNEVNMHYRKAKKECDIEIRESDAVEMMDEMNETYSEENCTRILQVLGEMNEELSSLIELRFMQRLSFQEIAGMYDITEANAKMKVYRALEKLKQLYQKSH
ncbi:MAG: sigma-70 family RNA polymerase sigma factor [Flavobacteriales bacterium]|nr:sigma-70 family RNA polymerase sigma factor [Flavobacteriales bacterium]